MKNILLYFITSLIFISCYKDKGNYNYTDLESIKVNGFEEFYSVYAFQDILDIDPVIENENKYDFCWEIINKSYQVGIKPVGDTLALTKKLYHPVKESPGEYFLVFRIKNKETNYTEILYSDLSISTQNMKGWYILKEENQYTDYDFYYEGGKIENWISFYNEGLKLKGSALKTICLTNLSNAPGDDNMLVLMAFTNEDASIFRIDNGSLVRSFEDMFFEAPQERNIQNILTPVDNGTTLLINNNKLHVMANQGGGLFQHEYVNDYIFTKFACVGYISLFFTENNRSITPFYMSNFSTFNDNNAIFPLNNTDSDVLWMEGFRYPRWTCHILLKNLSDHQVHLLMLNNNSSVLNYNNIVERTLEIDENMKFYNADCRAGNFEFEIIYFSVGNQIYRLDTQTGIETLQITLPEGEEITTMQHILFPVPAAYVSYTTNYIAVATHKDGKYKVWLYDMQVGNLIEKDKPDFEGTGRVSCITYVEPTGGSVVF